VIAALAFAAAVATPDHALAAKGERLYGQLCARCHGAQMVNTGTTAFDLRTFPADGHDRFVVSVGKGKNAMPAWENSVTPEEIELLWAYISAHAAPPGGPGQ
jgi:cytochrome c6